MCEYCRRPVRWWQRKTVAHLVRAGAVIHIARLHNRCFTPWTRRNDILTEATSFWVASPARYRNRGRF